jgi:hypothetical protein
MGGADAEPAGIYADLDREDRALPGMQLQPQVCGQEATDGRFPGLELCLVVGKEDEIVHVAQVGDTWRLHRRLFADYPIGWQPLDRVVRFQQ